MQNIVNLAVVVIIRYLQAIKNHEVRRNQNIETNFGEIRISFQIKIRRSLVDAPVFVINWIFVVEYNVLVARGNIKITKTGQILRPQENLKAGQNQVLDRPGSQVLSIPGQVLGAPGSQLLKVKKTFFLRLAFKSPPRLILRLCIGCDISWSYKQCVAYWLCVRNKITSYFKYKTRNLIIT